VLKRRLARGKVLEFFATLPACLVGLEACGAAHYWARELTKLGHEVRLMPPQYVRPYAKTDKHDAADAEACCEAVQHPGMRFVPAKGEDQQRRCGRGRKQAGSDLWALLSRNETYRAAV
jgi:transposase